MVERPWISASMPVPIAVYMPTDAAKATVHAAEDADTRTDHRSWVVEALCSMSFFHTASSSSGSPSPVAAETG